jgi:uncharacterized protein YkwD
MTLRLMKRLLVATVVLATASAMLGACSSDDDAETDDGSGGSGGTTFSTGTLSNSGGGAPYCGDGKCQSAIGEGCPSCPDDCKTYGASADDTMLDAEEQAFLTIINDYRMQNALPPLAGCVSLHRTAQGHSEDMRDNDYFSHDGLDGSQAWDRACGACFQKGCGPTTGIAENIAAGNADAQTTFIQWMNSPGHDANMLHPDMHFIGIGRAMGGGMYNVYWTNVFAEEDEASCY